MEQNSQILKNKEYIYTILNNIGAQKIKSTNNGFVCCCPIHKETNPSFAINKEGLWICFSCGEKGNLKQLIEKLNIKISDYKFYLEMFKINLNKKEEKEVKIEKINLDYIKYEKEEQIPPYLLKRLNFKTIKHFELGYSEIDIFKNYTIIPIKFNKKIVSYQARFNGEDPGENKRYLNPRGINIKQFIYNYDSIKNYKELIVTEGVFSVMSMWEKNIKNSCALLGAFASVEQIKLLVKLDLEMLHLCLDNDPAGIKCMLDIGKQLKDFLKIRVMILPENKDPNDLDYKDIYLIFRDSLEFEEFEKKYEKENNKNSSI